MLTPSKSSTTGCSVAEAEHWVPLGAGRHRQDAVSPGQLRASRLTENGSRDEVAFHCCGSVVTTPSSFARHRARVVETELKETISKVVPGLINAGCFLRLHVVIIRDCLNSSAVLISHFNGDPLLHSDRDK